MLVGMGGNNGSTLVATQLANQHGIEWHTKNGVERPNYIGSVRPLKDHRSTSTSLTLPLPSAARPGLDDSSWY